MQLNELRKELQFNNELLNLVETLKNVAGSQYHVMEKKKERFDRFMDAFSGFFRVVDLVEVADPLVKLSSDRIGIVVVTSDSGFMGGLNQGVMRAAFDVQGLLPDEQVSYIVIGDKGAGTFDDQDRVFKHFSGINQEEMYERALEIKDYIVQEVLEGRIGRVAIAYPKPVSFTSQTVEIIDILPCGELFDRGAESEVADHLEGAASLISDATRVIVESAYSDIVEYLAGVWVTSKLFEVFEDSKLSEFSARAMHLEGSQQKVEKTQKKVQHQVFKATHEQIDKGMRESFSAKSIKQKQRRRAATAA